VQSNVIGEFKFGQLFNIPLIVVALAVDPNETVCIFEFVKNVSSKV
jgi:hypothetical protein